MYSLSGIFVASELITLNSGTMWRKEGMPDVIGKTTIVTGGNNVLSHNTEQNILNQARITQKQQTELSS